jgi:hypothetical protein
MAKAITLAAAIGLSLATTVFATARDANVSVGAGSTSTRATVHSSTTGSAVHEDLRGPSRTPHGWSEGRKTGWGCKPGSRGCKPPGLH